MIIQPLRERFEPEVEEALRERLSACPDLAFAHLVEVTVPGHSVRPDPTLFAWLLAGSLRSLRGALNAVAEAVAETIPSERYVDVVILNSAPELLDPLERASPPLVVRDPGERERALAALAGDGGQLAPLSPAPRRRWFWPF